jgi:hypothetical protein
MNGAFRGMIKLRIQSVDAVIAMVAVSSVATALCGIVIATNAHDALHRVVPGTDRVEETSVAPAPVEADARRYPMAETSINLAARSAFDDARPNLGAAPERRHGRVAAGAPAARVTARCRPRHAAR